MGRPKRKRNDADASSLAVTAESASSSEKTTTTKTTTTTTALKTPPKNPASSNLTSTSENNTNKENAKKRKKNKWIAKLKQKISKAKQKIAAKILVRSASSSAAATTEPRTKKPKTTMSPPPTNNKKRKSPSTSSHQQRPRSRQKHHHLAYWIESCKETPPKEGVPCGPMTIVITRSYAGVTTTTTGRESVKDVISSLVPLYAGSAVKNIDDAKVTKGSNNNNDDEPFVHIIRAPSAKISKKQIDTQTRSIVSNNDLRIPNPHPSSHVPDKYWIQRHKLFSLFDRGIQLDAESWYSVTPEAIATHIAAKTASGVVKKKGGIVVLDAFCGCGGNAIAFSRRKDVSLVVGVDIDRRKLTMAAHNAALYGVPGDKLIFVNTDAIAVLKRCYRDGRRVDGCEGGKGRVMKEGGYRMGGVDLLPGVIDVVFLSPPWGGVDYERVGVGDYCLAKCVRIYAHEKGDREVLEDDEEEETDVLDAVDGDVLLQIAAKAARNKQVVYFLPRNTNGVSVGRSALKAGYRGYIEMEQNMLPSGKLKTITVYLNGSSSLPFGNELVNKEVPSKSTTTKNKVEDTIKSSKNSCSDSSNSSTSNGSSSEEDSPTIKTANAKKEEMKSPKPNGIGPATLKESDDSSSTGDDSSSSQDESSTTKQNQKSNITKIEPVVALDDWSVSSSSSSSSSEDDESLPIIKRATTAIKKKPTTTTTTANVTSRNNNDKSTPTIDHAIPNNRRSTLYVSSPSSSDSDSVKK